MRWRSAAEPQGVPEQARAVFSSAVNDGILDANRIAVTYLTWAQRSGSPAEIAEASWMRAVATAREAMRRQRPGARRRILTDVSQAAADAGLRLGLDGRVRDAAVIVEHSRAMILTRLIGGLDPRYQEILRAAGRLDLLDGYLGALRRQADAYREELSGTAGPTGAITRQGRVFAAGTASPLESAQADVSRWEGAVLAVVGSSDPMRLPDYDLLTRVAAEAPLVYLVPHPETGYAIVVPARGEPRFVALPLLRTDEVRKHAAPLIGRAVSDPASTAVSFVEAALRPVAGACDRDVAVVSLGAVSLLPVHAAFGSASVRFLPNARVAAQTSPWRVDRPPRRVLLIDAAADLPLARGEAAYLAQRYAPRSKRISDATVAAVLDRLPQADLVQFLCHGEADLTDPLRGHLNLADGPLTVQTLMSRPRRTGQQLVVLAACESQVGGGTTPDEVVSLPAALFQSGAVGIVASLWRVDLRAAMLVLRRFHEHFGTGVHPARALTSAQRWLRSATWGELSRRYPDMFAGERPPRSAALAARRQSSVPYADPVHWAAFTYTGH